MSINTLISTPTMYRISSVRKSARLLGISNRVVVGSIPTFGVFGTHVNFFAKFLIFDLGVDGVDGVDGQRAASFHAPAATALFFVLFKTTSLHSQS